MASPSRSFPTAISAPIRRARGVKARAERERYLDRERALDSFDAIDVDAFDADAEAMAEAGQRHTALEDGERSSAREIRVAPRDPMRHIGAWSGADIATRKTAQASENAGKTENIKTGTMKGARVFTPPPSGAPQASRAKDVFSGRGASINETGRFEREKREPVDDGWATDEELPPLRTEVTMERARTIVTRNDSPDISFDRSINPYRGCEHGCSYCFARPTHAYMGLSPGLDFESRLFVKEGAAALLERKLAAPGYQPRTIAIGTNTDPYQPIERTHRVMRSILEVLSRANHPVGIVTKSALVLRDLDILAPMAEKGLAKVALSVTTLDGRLARLMEPRAARPEKRLDTIRALSAAGVPTTVMVAPIIPAINEHEIETILTRARAAGAREAGYVMLRLPLEVEDVFGQWLLTHFPDRYRHVMSLVRGMREGKAYDSTFGKRMTGSGPHAWLVGRRFERAVEKLGFARQRARLRTDLFTPPRRGAEQLSLFR